MSEPGRVQTSSTENWHLGRYLGRRIYSRPHDGPDTQLSRWVHLDDVWVEKASGDLIIVAGFDWDGAPATARLLPTGRIDVELTEDEWKHVTITEYGSGMRSIRYSPDWTVRAPEIPIYHRRRRYEPGALFELG